MADPLREHAHQEVDRVFDLPDSDPQVNPGINYVFVLTVPKDEKTKATIVEIEDLLKKNFG